MHWAKTSCVVQSSCGVMASVAGFGAERRGEDAPPQPTAHSLATCCCVFCEDILSPSVVQSLAVSPSGTTARTRYVIHQTLMIEGPFINYLHLNPLSSTQKFRFEKYLCPKFFKNKWYRPCHNFDFEDVTTFNNSNCSNSRSQHPWSVRNVSYASSRPLLFLFFHSFGLRLDHTFAVNCIGRI